jgi:hypothetical protein
MAATIERVVTATVTKTSRTISRQGFNTLLGLFQVDAGVQASRFATYASLTEMLTAGFANTDSAYLWADTVFQQTPSPTKVAIGRRIPGTAKVYAITITAPEVGTWALDINGTIYSFIAGGADTNETIAAGLHQQVAEDGDAIVKVTDPPLLVDNFDTTAVIPGQDYTAILTPPGAGTGTAVITTPNAAAEDLETALDAVDLENSKDWYLFNIEERNDTDVETAADWAAARINLKFFIGQTNSDDMKTDTAPNIGTILNGKAYGNVFLEWQSSISVYEDGAMGGVAAAADLDAENGQITWALKSLKGVGFSELTSNEIDNIIANHGNVHIEIAGIGVTQEGKAVSGEFADVQTTIDWTKARVQEAVFSALATTPNKVPYTNAGIAQITGPFLGVLQTGVTNGHFSGDDPELPRVTAPTSSQVSQADKNDRILRNVIGEARLAGAIHKAILQVNLSV